jgi:hypothetical protein
MTNHADEELALQLMQTRVPIAIGAQFASLARERDRSVAAELRQAVREHLSRWILEDEAA